MKIYIQARGSYETLLNLSTWAEQNDIERIGLPDHYIVCLLYTSDAADE